MPRNTLALLAALALTACLAAPGHAREERDTVAPEQAYTVTFYDENDFFAGTDQHYTNAFRISALSKDLAEYAHDPVIKNHAPWLADLLEEAPFVNDRSTNSTHNVGFAFGNSIYTPVETRQRNLIREDRPYAGYTYVSLALHAKNATRLDTFETTIGMVGPSAGGKFVQDSWHHLINTYRAKGWHNQIHDEPVIGFTWQHADRTLYRDLSDDIAPGWAGDVIPHYGGTLGNAYTFANVGGQVRVGKHLPTDFGVSLIRPGSIVGAPGSKDDPQATGELGYNVFAGVDGRYMARNIFLDGNTWRDSHSVNRIPWVADVYGGASVIWHKMTFTYTHVYRTREFDEQGDGQLYGSFSIGYTF